MKRLSSRDIETFQAICAPSRARFGSDVNEDYSHDEMPEYGRFAPEALLTPLTAAEVSSILRHCNERGIPVTPRGAGTGLCGGAVPVRGGVVLDMRGMNRILELDQDNLTVTVEPGVLHMELTRYLEPYGLFYPPDPGEKSATLGGNVMTNAGGMRAVKYGVTRDYVAGLEIVLPGGEIVTLDGKTRKNSSGYDLKDLIIGSEGTLAVATAITLRLLAAPPAELTLLVPFDSMDKCIAVPARVMRERLIPAAVEFMQREVIELAESYLGREFPDKESEVYLLLRFDGDSKAEMRALYEKVADICLEEGARDVFIADTEDRQEPVWTMRGAFLEAIKGSTSSMDECDVVVPVDKMSGFAHKIERIRKDSGLRVLYFGHAGDGNLHVYLLKDDLDEETWKKKRDAVMDELYGHALALGGQISGEHGIGHGKLEYLRRTSSGTVNGLMSGIKAVFDPKGIMNPGKVVEGRSPRV